GEEAPASGDALELVFTAVGERECRARHQGLPRGRHDDVAAAGSPDQASCELTVPEAPGAISCSVHVLPSGSANPAYSIPPRSSMSPTSTPRSVSVSRVLAMSATTRCRPRSVPGFISTAGKPVDSRIEHADPGGVSWTTRTG